MTGRCAATMQQVALARSESPTKPPPRLPEDSTNPHPTGLYSPPLVAHLLLIRDLILYASGQALATPTVHVFQSSLGSGLSIPYGPLPGSRVSVTALCLDHSSAIVRLAIFYSDCTWAVHTIDYDHRMTTPTYTYGRRGVVELRTPIIQAAYHHPLLVTLTTSFCMSIFYLPSPPASPILKHTLSSYSGFTPLTMTLSRYRTPEQYRVLLAYASPIYPAHWGPCATDITLSTQSVGAFSSSAATTSSPLPPVKIVSSSSTNNQLPVGWIPDGTPDGIPDELRLRWSRKVSHVSGIQTDGKFVVFASEDGGIQVRWSQIHLQT